MSKRKLFPRDYIKSTYDIDFAALREQGYEAVIFDVDNTLVPHNAKADDRAKDLFKELNSLGFKAMLLSNNKEPRVKQFKEDVVFCEYIYKAGKPKKDGYLRAVEQMGAKPETTIFVGDQILTDIWGANNADIRSVMVMPVKKWREEIQIILKRFLEAIILLCYKVYTLNDKNIDRVPLKKEKN